MGRGVLGVLIVTLAGAGVAVAVLLTRTHPSRRPVQPLLHVSVAGRDVVLRRPMPLQEVTSRFRVRPRTADLLDVEGHVLRHNAFSAPILLDGAPAAGSTLLRDGDRITTPPAHDRRERLARDVVPVPDGMLSDPEGTLARTPGVSVLVDGALSHELVSTQFRPSAEPVPPAAVALTFDDGPSLYTPSILAVLRRFHVPATFFTIGYLAAASPELIRAETTAGMEVGNHTYNHPEVPPFNQLPPRLQADEIGLAADELRHIGVDATVFRPPAGSSSPAVVAAAERAGERVVLWSVDPSDWKVGTTAKQIVRSVLGAVQPGSIVLLHDGGGDRSATVAALPAIIRGIRHRGLRLVTVDGF